MGQFQKKDDKKERRQPYPGEVRPKKDAILNLADYQDKELRIQFTGGREVVGTLTGYDQLMNLVLENVKESIRDPAHEGAFLDKTRDLGTVVVRGPLIQTIAPAEVQVIASPFN